MKTTPLSSSARIGRFDVANRQACACEIRVRLASTVFSLGSGKGDIEFP